MCVHIASFKFSARKKTKLFLSLFFLFASQFCLLAEAFRNEHVAACSTALRKATEKNEMSGFVTIAWSSKMTHRSSKNDWIKFW